MKTPCAVTAWFDANRVAEVKRYPNPDGDGPIYYVTLRCGGPSGAGASVAEALDDARGINADWLELAA